MLALIVALHSFYLQTRTPVAGAHYKRKLNSATFGSLEGKEARYTEELVAFVQKLASHCCLISKRGRTAIKKCRD